MSDAHIKVRFAPSPTGRIHIGNARTALFNWLYAKKRGGQFVLRFDDTDVARSTREFADGIAVDLAWLGIKPDQVERQSDRFDRYAMAVDGLRKAGKLYACYETRRRAGLPSQAPDGDAPPADLRSCGAQAHRCRQSQAGGRGTQAALALPA